MTDTVGFGNADLHVIDIGPIPDRFADRIRKTEYQEILDGFLAEVVIDPIDVELLKRPVQRFVHTPSARMIAAKRLFEHGSHPATGPLNAKPAIPEALNVCHRQLRGRPEMVNSLVSDAVGAIQLLDASSHRAERACILVAHRLVEAALQQISSGGPVRGEDFTHSLAKRFVIERRARDAKNVAALIENIFGEQAKERRQQFAAGKIAGSAKDDDGAGLGFGLRVGFVRHCPYFNWPAADFESAGVTAWPPNSRRNAASTRSPNPFS